MSFQSSMGVDLQKAGGVLTEGGVEIGGWRVESTRGHMSRDAELEDIKEKLGGVMRIPEIVFGQNTLLVKHLATGLTIRFDALGALKAWTAEERAPLQLDIAEEWKRARQSEIEQHDMQQLQYDWTFTTPYRGTYLPSDVEDLVVECEGGLDQDMLASREDPILFYDALSLYESELDDRGISQCKVQIRVMSSYWFLALRFFLRVDHHLIRLYETRLFSSYHRSLLPFFQGQKIGRFASGPGFVRDVKHWEVTFEDLRRQGAPCDMLAYRDAEAAGAQLSVLSPMGCIFDCCQQLIDYNVSR